MKKEKICCQKIHGFAIRSEKYTMSLKLSQLSPSFLCSMGQAVMKHIHGKNDTIFIYWGRENRFQMVGKQIPQNLHNVLYDLAN